LEQGSLERSPIRKFRRKKLTDQTIDSSGMSNKFYLLYYTPLLGSSITKENFMTGKVLASGS